MSDIEDLQLKHPELAARLIAFAQELAPLGGRLKIDMPGNYPAPQSATPTPNADRAVLAAQPAKGEVTKDQAASWARAGLTAVSSAVAMLGALGWLGWIKPEHLSTLNNPALAGLLSGVIFAAARLWSLYQSKKKATEKSQEVTTALHTSPLKADETPVSVEEVKAKTKEVVQQAQVSDNAVKGEGK